MNKRQAEQLMRKMGIVSQDIDATEVIIKTQTKELVISNPQVSKVNMMGQDTYQIVGHAVERLKSVKAEINDEDIETVMDSANVSKDEAEAAIKAADGDLAKAIMELKK